MVVIVIVNVVVLATIKPPIIFSIFISSLDFYRVMIS